MLSQDRSILAVVNIGLYLNKRGVGWYILSGKLSGWCQPYYLSSFSEGGVSKLEVKYPNIKLIYIVSKWSGVSINPYAARPCPTWGLMLAFCSKSMLYFWKKYKQLPLTVQPMPRSHCCFWFLQVHYWSRYYSSDF